MKVANLLDEEIPQIYALTGRCAALTHKWQCNSTHVQAPNTHNRHAQALQGACSLVSHIACAAACCVQRVPAGV
jgi:hypothetical protein